MADNGVALSDARETIHRLRSNIRRADKALALAAAGEDCGAIVYDADEGLDEEQEGCLLDLVASACAGHPGGRIEVIVVAHKGADTNSKES